MAKYLPNIVSFGDVHLGTYRYPVRSYIIDALDQVVRYVRRNKPDIVIFCGDAFRTRTPTARDMDIFGTAIWEMAAVSPVLMIPGNHDIVGHQASLLDVYDKYGNVIVSRFPEVYPMMGMDIATFPWLPSKALSSQGLDREDLRGSTEVLVQLITKKMQTDSLKVMVGHCTALGATWGDEVSTIMGHDVLWSSDWFKGFDIAFLGHLHKPQVVPGTDHVGYVGSLCPVSFNELDQEKSFIHYKDGEVKRISIEGPAFTQVDAADLKKLDPDNFMGTFVQIIKEHDDPDPEPPDCLWYEIIVRPPKRDMRQRLDPEEAQMMLWGEAIAAYLESEGYSENEIDEVLQLAYELRGD